MPKIKIGIILFIDEKNGTNGVGYSEHLKNKKIKISSYNKLDEDIIWFTNINNEALPLDNKIKKANYFGITLDTIIYQLGLTSLSRLKIVEGCYHIIDNIVNNTNNLYDYKNTHNNLKDSILPILKNNIKKDTEILDILKQDNSNFQVNKTARSKDENQAYLFMPRFNYNENMQNLSIPNGKWSNIKTSTFIDKNKDWFIALSKKYHFIVNVTISNVPKELNLLLSEKSSANKTWITDFEFLFYSKLCDIKIHQLKINSEKEILNDIFSQKVISVQQIERDSISSGIIANAYTQSIVEKNKNNIISYWINSYDKLEMLKCSLYFIKNNIKVISFGAGSVLISYSKNEDVRKIILLSNKLNLQFPSHLLTL
jgi:hypothetical protein